MPSILDRVGGGSGSVGSVKESKATKSARAERFKNLVVDTNPSINSSSFSQGGLLSPKRIKGRSQEVERGFLRLTGVADPQSVRPEKVLKLALENVKTKYKEDDDYLWACDQLKSIRQDLTIQGIKGRFCAHAYETHARIALEQGDLPEYHGCQSRLQEMRARGAPIAADEFDCYRILYALHVGNTLELALTITEVEKNRQVR